MNQTNHNNLLDTTFLKNLTKILEPEIPVFCLAEGKSIGTYVEVFGDPAVKQLALCVFKCSDNTIMIFDCSDIEHKIAITFNEGWDSQYNMPAPEKKGVYISHIAGKGYFGLSSNVKNPVKFQYTTDAKTVAQYLVRTIYSMKQLGLYDYIIKPSVDRCWVQYSNLEYNRTNTSYGIRPMVNSTLYQIGKWLGKHSPTKVYFGTKNAIMQKNMVRRG